MRWSRLWPSKFVAGQGPRRSAAAGTVLAAEIRADDAGLGYSSGAAKAVVRRMAPFGAFPLPTPHRRGASAHEMQLTLSDCRPRHGSCAQRHLPHSSDSSSRNARRVAAVRPGALPQEQAAPAGASAWWPCRHLRKAAGERGVPHGHADHRQVPLRPPAGPPPGLAVTGLVRNRRHYPIAPLSVML